MRSWMQKRSILQSSDGKCSHVGDFLGIIQWHVVLSLRLVQLWLVLLEPTSFKGVALGFQRVCQWHGDQKH